MGLGYCLEVCGGTHGNDGGVAASEREGSWLGPCLLHFQTLPAAESQALSCWSAFQVKLENQGVKTHALSHRQLRHSHTRSRMILNHTSLLFDTSSLSSLLPPTSVHLFHVCSCDSKWMANPQKDQVSLPCAGYSLEAL